MKKYFIILLIALVGITAFKSKNEDLKQIFLKINQDVLNNGKAYETLGDATSTIGHRLTGSNNGKKQKNMLTICLKIWVQPNPIFTVCSWVLV